MNCNQQLKRYRKQKTEEDKLFAVYQAYHILGLLTLYEDLGCRETRLNKFGNGLVNRMQDYQSGKLTYEDMVNKLNKYGINIEGVNWDGKERK